MPALTPKSRGRRAINEINMVPFIDVMLVLLIIFMVTAPLITPSTIELPSVSKAAQQSDAVIQVLIQKDGTLTLKPLAANAQAVPANLDSVGQNVKQLQGGQNTMPVVISADKNVSYEIVVNVMDRLKRAGIERVGLSVQTIH